MAEVRSPGTGAHVVSLRCIRHSHSRRNEFWDAKFDLAQMEAKLVGEIAGRYGRSPNPAIVRAIHNWPPVYTLKQSQEFLGAISYVRPHCGPEYSRVANPLRPLLKPGAKFPPNEAQVLAIDQLKKLVS